MMVLLQRPLCLGTATEAEKEHKREQEKNCLPAVGTSQLLKAGVSLKILLGYCATMERSSCQTARWLAVGWEEAFEASTENPRLN